MNGYDKFYFDVKLSDKNYVLCIFIFLFAMNEPKVFIIREYSTRELSEKLEMSYSRLLGIIKDKGKEIGLGKRHGKRWMASQVEKIIAYTGVPKKYRQSRTAND